MSRYKILVATHKKFLMPKESLYLPVHVGAIGKEDLGYQRDDQGINISDKNGGFCELTGIYWAYKNLNVDYWGIVHYRRYFRKKYKYYGNKFTFLLDEDDLNRLFSKCDIILPKRQRYYIETIYSHYAHTHHKHDLELTRNVLSDLCPDYVKDWDTVMRRRSAHMFNMFIMKREYAQTYCDWLFPILFELEKRVDLSLYDAFHSRLFGRISEFLLDVWLEHNQLSYIEVPIIFMGKINWLRKIGSFLKAKYKGEKYHGSF